MDDRVYKLESGFTYSLCPFNSGVLVAVLDERKKDTTTPVAVVANVPASEVETLVQKAIRLYRCHQVITLVGSFEEFIQNFSKVA